MSIAQGLTAESRVAALSSSNTVNRRLALSLRSPTIDRWASQAQRQPTDLSVPLAFVTLKSGDRSGSSRRMTTFDDTHENVLLNSYPKIKYHFVMLLNPHPPSAPSPSGEKGFLYRQWWAAFPEFSKRHCNHFAQEICCFTHSILHRALKSVYRSGFDRGIQGRSSLFKQYCEP